MNALQPRLPGKRRDGVTESGGSERCSVAALEDEPLILIRFTKLLPPGELLRSVSAECFHGDRG